MTEEQKRALFKKVWQDPKYFTAFGFGLGTLPYAPGTWGSVLGVAFCILFAQYSWWVYLLAVALFFVMGVWLCESVSKDMGKHDHQGIVWDEVVGMMLSLFLFKPTLSVIIIGFVLFRLFDILKPWPIAWADKQIKGGLGIMLDDVLAAVPTWCCLMLLSILGLIG